MNEVKNQNKMAIQMSNASTLQMRNTTPHQAYEIRATKKREYLDQFKILLRELYTSDSRMKGFCEDPDTDNSHYSDPDNHVVLAIKGERVIGGICIRISTPEYPIRLDMEDDILPLVGKESFSIQDLFPQLDLANYAYAECNRIVLHPDFRDGDLLDDLVASLVGLCDRYHVRHLFAISDLVRLRSYRKAIRKVGEDAHICSNLNLSMRQDFDGLKIQMIYGEFSAFKGDKTTPHIEQQQLSA